MGCYIAKELGRDISDLPYNVLSSDRLREEFGRQPSSLPQTEITAAELHGLPAALDRRLW